MAHQQGVAIGLGLGGFGRAQRATGIWPVVDQQLSPSAWPSLGASARARMSVLPPGVKGTISLIGLLAWDQASGASADAVAANSLRRRKGIDGSNKVKPGSCRHSGRGLLPQQQVSPTAAATMQTMTHTAQDPARTALACLDLTSLNDGDTAASVAALAGRARQAAASVGAPAALCVWPRFVRMARSLAPAGVKVAAVLNFPAGGIDMEQALREARQIIFAGADELDLVLPWRHWMVGDAAPAAALVRAVREASRGRTLKLIIESGELAEPELVRAACLLGLDLGVDFLKTSTGKTTHGATPEAAREMLETIAGHPRGSQVGFKASGGIRSVADAAVYIDLVQEILGPAALNPQRLRFGASGLLADIEATLAGTGAGNTSAPDSY